MHVRKGNQSWLRTPTRRLKLKLELEHRTAQIQAQSKSYIINRVPIVTQSRR